MTAGTAYFGLASTAKTGGAFSNTLSLTGGIAIFRWQGEYTVDASKITGGAGELCFGGNGPDAHHGKLIPGASGTASFTVGELSTRGTTLTIESGVTVNAERLRTSDSNTAVSVVNVDGTLNVTGSNNSSTTDASFLLAHWSNGTSTLNVNDGGVINSLNANVVINWDGTSTLNVKNGGTMNVRGLDMNVSKGTGNKGTFNLETGGTINVGVGGIDNSAGKNVNLGAGTVGALADWSSTGVLTLNGGDTGTTFNTNAQKITINGNLGGSGALNVAGGGTLEIASAAEIGTRKVSVAEGTTLSFASTGANTLDSATTTISGRLNVNSGANVGVNGSIAVGGFSVNTLNTLVSGAGNTMTVQGSNLADAVTARVSGGTVALEKPGEALIASKGAALRLDASRISGVAEGGSVTTWEDTSGSGRDATATGTISYTATDATTGNPALVFSTGGDSSFSFDRITGIKAAFWVLKECAAESNRGHTFLLGDAETYHFHSGTAGQMLNSNAMSSVRQGTWLVNGSTVAPENTTLTADAWSLISFQQQANSTESLRANTFSRDRTIGDRSWNGSASELLIFTESLTDEETRIINAYLNDKWNLGGTGEYFDIAYTAPNVTLDVTDDTTLDASGFNSVSMKAIQVASGKTLSVTQTRDAQWTLDAFTGNLTLTGGDFASNGTKFNIGSDTEAGMLTFSNSAALTNGVINIDIFSTDFFTGFDQILAEDTLDVTGAQFNITFDDTYTPTSDDYFDIAISNLSENGILGFNADAFTFDGAGLWAASLVGDGSIIRISADATSAVPEPSSWALLILGGISLAWFGRRRFACLK
ncbi:MAG: PEP-CTERM sorting domain-containing protein [Planctomycetia bacterium]|nr:PEP-CTERM sorting domain-containing protein [Planctomycetia bacterium]